jgi:hypothetical protein
VDAVEVEQAGRWVDGKNGGKLHPGTITRGPRRATVAVREALVEALRDPRGGSGKEFFIRLKTGTAEDRRVFANVVTKLIPVEVEGGLGEMLKINIMTYVAAPNAMPLAPARLESTSPHDAPSVNVQPTAVPTVVAGETRESPERDAPRCRSAGG